MPDPIPPLPDAARIAMVRLSALGDVVNVLPALTALRRARPEAHIAWVCETAAAGILEGHPLLDELITLDRKGWFRSLRSLRSMVRLPSEALALRRKLRSNGFDVAIDFQGNSRGGLVTRLTGARTRIGLARRHARECGHLFATHRVELPEGPVHRVERALRLVAALGVDTEDAQPVVPATDADRDRVTALLAERGLGPGRFALIAAGSSTFGQYKQWTPEGWAALAGQLKDELDWPTLFLRGPDPAEGEAAETMAEAAGPCARAAPLLSLRELGELSRRSGLFFGIDSGPTHLASAAGATVVGLFGPEDPQVYRPYFGKTAVVEKPRHCRPCKKRSCDDPQCMLTITADDVMNTAKELL